MRRASALVVLLLACFACANATSEQPESVSSLVERLVTNDDPITFVTSRYGDLMIPVPLEKEEETSASFLEQAPSNGTTHCVPGYKCPFRDGVCCPPAFDTCCETRCIQDIPANVVYCEMPQDSNLMNEEAQKGERAEYRRMVQEQRAKRLASETNMKDDKEEWTKRAWTEQEDFNKRLRMKQERSTKKYKAADQAHQQQMMAARYREEYSKRTKNKLELSNNFRCLEQGYRKATFILVEDICVVTGVVIGPDTRLPFVTLPPECRPFSRLVFDQHIAGVKTARFDVLGNGKVLYVGGAYKQGGNNQHWVMLDGLIFPVVNAPTNPLPLEEPWVNYGKGTGDDTYQGARIYARHHDGSTFCMITGLVRTKDSQRESFRSTVFIAEPPCRPNGRIIFHINSHSASLRADMFPSGKLELITADTKNSWISLTGINFVPNGGKPLDLLNGWKPYQRGYRAPTVYKIHNMCVLSGLAKATKGWRSHMANVPVECRPDTRIVFAVNHHTGSMRLDIFADGMIRYISGFRRNHWVTFDGIIYTVP